MRSFVFWEIEMVLNTCSVRALAPFAFVSLLAFATPTSAATYDLTTDWSDTANANGPWAYYAGSHLLPAVSSWSGVGPGFADSGTFGNTGFVPSIFRNNGSMS